MSFISNIFGDANQKEINRLKFLVNKINALEPEMEQLKDSDFPTKTAEYKDRIKNNESLDNLLPEAFALCREASKRAIGQRHYDVQLMSGITLHEGKISEQRTGEGKTLSATLPLYLNALSGKGSHLVTVNDFLAKFQAQWMGRIYDFLGMTVASIEHDRSYLYTKEPHLSKEDPDEIVDDTWQNLRLISRHDAYYADITYGTNNEFGFDYLRDNMAVDLRQLNQRELNFAIVDEVDSILIDEARTPLIISAPAEESGSDYQRFAQIIKNLKPEKDFDMDEKARTIAIKDDGIQTVEQSLSMDNLYAPENIRLVHHLEEALKAEFLFKRDKDYVVKDGEVMIVDEFTGRLMPGRRYSEGLHQAIEAKEGVAVQRESNTLATISFQNFFRMYKKLAGMTGTAATEAEEFYKIYKLDVTVIPTNREMVRIDHQDKIYKTEEAKTQAIIEEVRGRNEKGQPVLIGTISVAKNEELARLLKMAGIPHNVLNAKRHQQEAKIVAQAGRVGAVTLATNMAGRGVDIILGGTPPGNVKVQNSNIKIKADNKNAKTEEVGLEKLNKGERMMEDWEKEHSQVLELGGLFVIGTERHEARRIDNQLRGRAGRQGDPGESQFFVSMEDDLMRIFGGDRLKNMMDRLGLPDDVPIENKFVSRSIEGAQKKVEGHNFDIRKHLVEYDDVANKQREVIYKKRRQILAGKGRDSQGKDVDLHNEISELLGDEAVSYEKKMAQADKGAVAEIEKRVYLRTIDMLWIEHLNTMDYLRHSIGLKGYGQKDPLVEYKQEAYNIFQRLLRNIDAEVSEMLLKIEVRALPAAPVQAPQQVQEIGAKPENSGQVFRVMANEPKLAGQANGATSQGAGGVMLTVRKKKSGKTISQSLSSGYMGQKVGRNDKCPCGSNKKFKKCHGR
ncbi:MAG: preprotein translocase subunit SecA [Patescibacteria group bacterium]